MYTLGNFQRKLREDLCAPSSPYAPLSPEQIVFMTDNKPIEDYNALERKKLYVQLSSVDPLRESRCAFKSDFGTTKDSDPLDKQSKRRVLHYIPVDAVHDFTLRARVIKSTERMLTPIESAIEMMSDRVELINSELQYDPPRLNSLQQVLQGSVLPMVNAGPLAVAQVFLGDDAPASDKTTGGSDARRDELRDVLRRFIALVGEAVVLNSQIITEKHRKFGEMVQQHVRCLCTATETRQRFDSGSRGAQQFFKMASELARFTDKRGDMRQAGSGAAQTLGRSVSSNARAVSSGSLGGAATLQRSESSGGWVSGARSAK